MASLSGRTESASDEANDDSVGSCPGNTTAKHVPSNVYLLNVAFYSFSIFALGQMFVAIFIAKSQAMVGDSSAMVIDSLTYLFNSYAERIKNMSLQESEDETLSEHERELRRLGRTRQRLWLEILPPMCSVLTLIGLTSYILSDAVKTLANSRIEDGTKDDPTEANDGEASADEPDITIMFFFSALNLGLDILNVTCFAKAKHALGFAVIDKDRHRYVLAYDGSLHNQYADSLRVRSEIDLSGLDDSDLNGAVTANYASIKEGENSSPPSQNQNVEEKKQGFHEVNLNMCSAYTHVFADTLRSTAVLIAAGIAYIFKVGTPEVTDAAAAVTVSIIILLSLGPLLRGILHAWGKLRLLSNIAVRLTETKEDEVDAPALC